ncbi:hypothetical protein OSC13_08715 [Serratia marcescens]|uniref:phage tail tube protein n=1 Tax=Serratia marcescens TaxID=615 RepID=UPI002874180D|nr:hypothetical protein [Serratia marcescens]MDS0777974.1 hypothetical protein [Serratia marcescens]
MSDFYYGQGKLYLARRNTAGQALSWRWVGDVSALAIEIEFDEKKTKMSLGGRLIDSQRYITSASAKVTSTWHEYSTENLQLLFLSNGTNQASEIVTGELLPADIQAGDTISLRHQNVFSVVLHSLVAGVDYLIDPLWGVIRFIKTPAQQPVIADYAHIGYATIPLLNDDEQEFCLRYEGINLAEKNENILVELYRVKFDPVEKIDLINNEQDLAALETSATTLLDASKMIDPNLGQLGRIVKFRKTNGITHNGTILHNGFYTHGGN